MPVEIEVFEKKFYNQLKNGVDFSTETDYTTNLAGSVMMRIKASHKLRIRWYAKASTSDVFTVNSGKLSITRVTGNFLTDGFCEGDSILVDIYSNTVSSVTEKTLYLNSEFYYPAVIILI